MFLTAQLWFKTIATPAGPTVPKPLDFVLAVSGNSGILI